MRGLAVVLLISLFIIESTEAGFRSRSFSYKDRSQKSSYSAQSLNPKEAKPKNQQASSQISRRGSALSAWGIIGIILAAILITTTGYYAFVFYPYLCKKERKYDMIELTNVV